MTSFAPDALPTKLDTMTDRIRQILLDTPSARSSDKILLITYMRRHGLFCYDEAVEKLAIEREKINMERDRRFMEALERVSSIKAKKLGSLLSDKQGKLL